MKTFKFIFLLFTFHFSCIPAFAQWVLLNSGTTNFLYEVHFPATDTGYAVGELGTILKTTDGGTSWITLNSGTTANLYSVYFTDVNTGCASGDYSGLDSALIIKTNDGGQTWNCQFSDTVMQYSMQLKDLYFINDSVGFAGGKSDSLPGTPLILKTTNGGTTWNIINVPSLSTGSNALITAIHFPVQDTGYALTINSPVFKTFDQGTTWSHFSNSGAGSIVNEDIFFIDANSGFSVGWYPPGIAKTIDGGVTWNQVTPQTFNGFYSVHFINEDTGYAGGGGGILKTINGGNNWFNTDSTIAPYSIFCLNEAICYAVGNGGTILKTTNGGVGINEMKKKNEKEIIIYPDPMHTTATLTINSFQRTANYELIIYNVLGRIVRQSEIRNQKTEIKRGDLPGGMFFYKISDQKNFFATGKLIIQ